MCPANRLGGCFRHPEVFHLALLNQLFHRSRYVFNRDLGVYAVLIEQIDGIDLESFKRALDSSFDVSGRLSKAYRTRRTVVLKFESELRRNHDLFTEGARASPTSSSLAKGP